MVCIIKVRSWVIQAKSKGINMLGSTHHLSTSWRAQKEPLACRQNLPRLLCDSEVLGSAEDRDSRTEKAFVSRVPKW